jgi:class 3 adenylate cyclase/tetratricopeptide (TPR) repeat protein
LDVLSYTRRVVICPSCGKENPDGFAFCGYCTVPLAVLRPAPGMEERKIVSVLFCDLVGFTAASEQQDPEDVRARIRPYHARLRQEIERYDGTVEKFVGDAVMAVFGAPVAHEDDAERAVRAGLRILQAIAELNEADSELGLQVRVGINTGDAVVALGARPEQGEGIVTGDVVNTAARIESAAPVNGIAVSEQTYRATSRVFEYELLAPVSVKGKAEPLALWRPLTARARFGRDVLQYETPFVGRELEKPLLIGTFERASQQRSVQLVTIVGEPGVGKSRLAAELFAYIDATPGLARWRQGRCLPYGEGITFWALGEIVKAEAGILESDSAEVAAAKVDAAVSPEEPDRQWLLQRLAPLVGLEASSPAERQELFTAWRRFFEGLAAANPTVLVFEDLHWADEALLAFLAHLAEWSQGVPLLVLCAARPELYERRPGWGAGLRNATTINLPPLSDRETSELVSHLVTETMLSRELEHAILERAGGNPLYAEEFVRLLADRGLDTLSQAAAPASVQALIAARLDTLSPERKSLLQDAAVVGRVFWSGAVREIGDRDEGEVELALHELSRKELVRPARTSSMAGESEYAFWHLLVRDVAYSQIPRAERARRHRAAAAWIERKAGERVEDLAEVLAHHYLQALELARAAGSAEEAAELELPTRRFLVLAGDRAFALDVGRAGSYYERALELFSPGAPERPDVLAKAGEAAYLAGRPDAEPRYAAAIAEFRAQGNPLGAGKALVRLSEVQWYQGETRQAWTRLDEAVELLESEAPGPELAHAYSQIAREHMLSVHADKALEWSEKALALAEELGLGIETVRAHQFRGMARGYLGDLGGLQDLREAVRLSLDLGLGLETVRAHANLGEAVWLDEGPRQALDVWRAGIDFGDRRGIVGLVRWVRAQTVWALFDLGEWEELLHMADELIAWEEAHGESYVGGLALPYKAHVLVRSGRVDEAAALAEEFLPRARSIDDPQVLAPVLAVAALIEKACGRSSAALSLVEELESTTRDPFRANHVPDAVRICAAAGRLPLARKLLDEVPVAMTRHRYVLLTGEAVVAEAEGHLGQAAEQYADAAERWGDYGHVPEQALALLGRSRCLLALGRPGAEEPLREACEVFASMGFKPALAETEALLEQTAAAPASRRS